ncbi:MAG: hypothetical protein ACQEP7_01970 [bacterium]
MSVVYKKFKADRVIYNSLLQNSRFSQPEEDPPELYWVFESGAKNYLLWQPKNELPVEFEAATRSTAEEPRWKLTIQLWQRYRQISPLEKAFILKHITESFADKNQQNKVAECLSIPRSDEWLDCYRRLTELDSSLQEEIHDGKISPKVFRYLFQLPRTIYEPLLKDLEEEKISFTLQQSRQLAEAFRRITKRSENRWAEIRKQAYDFSNQRRQRAEKLLELVRKWAYPRLTGKIAEFEEEKNRLNLWSGLAVDPPDNFEGDSLEFNFSCGDEGTLERAVNSLEKCRSLLKFV